MQQQTAGPVRAAVVSPHELVRLGLTAFLATDPRRATVVEAAAPERDVAVVDLAALTDPSQGELVRQLLAAQVPVLGVVHDRQPGLVRGAALIGVAEIVPVTVSSEELLDTVDRLARRTEAGTPAPAAGTPEPADGDDGGPAPFDRLTRRERQVLALIGAGLTNQEIAEGLFVSVNSIKTYVRTGYRRIGVLSRPQAAAWAVQHGLVAAAPPVETRTRAGAARR